MAFWIGRDVLSNPRNALHIQIQLLAMIENWDIIHAEYPIPIGRIRQIDNTGVELSDDLIEALEILTAQNLTYVDLLNEATGEMWEIKPKQQELLGALEVQARLSVMAAAQLLGLLRGNNHPIRGGYDWTLSPEWVRGFSLWNIPIFLVTDPTGWMSFYARQSQQGVIIWWKVQNPSRQPSEYPLPVPEDVVWSLANREETHPVRVYVTGRGVVTNPIFATSAICTAACHYPGYTQPRPATPEEQFWLGYVPATILQVCLFGLLAPPISPPIPVPVPLVP